MLGNPPWETRQAAGAGVLRHPRARRSPRRRTPPPARRRSRPSRTTNPQLLAEFDARDARSRGREPVPPQQRPLPAVRRRRRQHLQRLRRALPRHAWRRTGAAASSRRPGWPPTRPRRPSSPTPCAAERLAAFYDFENEAKIFAGVHNQFRFAVSSMTGGERVTDVRLAFYTPLRRRRADPTVRACSRRGAAAQPEHRHPAGLPNPARRRDHPGLLPTTPGADPRRRRGTLGACASPRSSTWPTTSGLFRTADDLDGRGRDLRRLGLATRTSSAGCRSTRRRCSATGTTASRPTQAPRRPSSTRARCPG